MASDQNGRGGMRDQLQAWTGGVEATAIRIGKRGEGNAQRQTEG